MNLEFDRERERGRKFNAKRGREREKKKELSKAEKRDAEYSICKWSESPSSRLKRTL